VICLVIQPIHQAGTAVLQKAGITVRQASKPDMATVVDEITDADAAITRNAGLSRDAMHAAVRLRVLGVHGIGVDPVDMITASDIGLPVANTPEANVQSVAELAISQMLSIARRVREGDAAMRAGNYSYRYSRDFHELSGAVLLIVGFGRIGRRTAEMARAAFGMRVLVHSPSVPPAAIEGAGFELAADLDEALPLADYVSLHQVLTPRTRGWLDRERLNRMKKGATLVNTARGALVDAEALIGAVQSGHLRGAAMDVFDKEPLPPGEPLAAEPGILLSPHIGGSTEEALERTAVQVATAVIEALEGRRPRHLVNPDVWPRRRQPFAAMGTLG
jgi:D-3-phosphoglycerate dehydrogenase